MNCVTFYLTNQMKLILKTRLKDIILTCWYIMQTLKALMEILPEVVDFPENPAELLKNLISSPRLGIVFKESEAHEVKKEVLKLMNKIVILISTTNPAFRCTVYPTGSSEDGSKIGEADEFDFTFCLDYFSEECMPHQEEDMMNTGFATLKLNSFHESHPLSQYLADGHVIESFIVRDTFQDLFTNAVNNPDTWKENVFYFDGLLKFPIDKPILNMEVHWRGPIMKDIIISIDVVPAVCFPRWMPKEMETRNQDLAIQRESIQDGCFLLFQPPEVRNKERRKYLRISRFSSELQYLKSLTEVYLESYAAAKILISNRFCPRLLFSEEFNFDEIFVDSSDKASSSDVKNQITVGLKMWKWLKKMIIWRIKRLNQKCQNVRKAHAPKMARRVPVSFRELYCTEMAAFVISHVVLLKSMKRCVVRDYLLQKKPSDWKFQICRFT